MLAAITSHITDDPDAIPISGGDFAEGRLPKQSIVKTTKLFTIHASLIVKKICKLKRERTENVLRSMRAFFS